jgi:hypothetical protein
MEGAMKLILEFQLPDEDSDYQQMINGPAYHRALVEVDELCRYALKRGHKFMTINHALEAIREKIRAELSGVYREF